MIKVLVCGGRTFGMTGETRNFIWSTLDDLVREKWDEGKILIIEGGAKGADACAKGWAKGNLRPTLSFPADWGTWGPGAGPFRNKQMLEEGKPDLVIAFPGGKGTANMVKIAKEAGVEVREIKYNDS